MKKIIWYWNLVYFNLFKFQKHIESFFDYPFILLLNNKIVKKFYSKRGVNTQDLITAMKESSSSKKAGFAIVFSRIQMGGITVLLEYSLFNIILVIIGESYAKMLFKNSTNLIIIIFLLSLLAIIINEQVIYNNKKYLEYFTEFESEPQSISFRHSLYSFFILIGILIVFLGSFILYTH